MRDLDTELRTQGERVPRWDPQPGERLVGRIVRYDQGETPYGSVRIAIVERETDGALVKIWISKFALKEKFEQEKPRVGDRIGLKYCGMRTTKAGRQCHVFELLVDRAEVPQQDPFEQLHGEITQTTRSGARSPASDRLASVEAAVPPSWPLATANRRKRR